MSCWCMPWRPSRFPPGSTGGGKAFVGWGWSCPATATASVKDTVFPGRVSLPTEPGVSFTRGTPRRAVRTPGGTLGQTGHTPAVAVLTPPPRYSIMGPDPAVYCRACGDTLHCLEPRAWGEFPLTLVRPRRRKGGLHLWQSSLLAGPSSLYLLNLCFLPGPARSTPN